MKITPLLTLGLAALLAGCSSTPTQVSSGPIKASTFSFITPPQQNSAVADERAPVHQMIQEAITQDLAGKGLRKVDSGGDVTVAYMVIIGNNASTEAINTYFGYGRDTVALNEKAQEAYNSSKNPNYFAAGTLLVDLVDAKTFKLLERNHATRPVLNNPTAEMREANIREAVAEALKNVRIEH
jgi:hypothetical protein